MVVWRKWDFWTWEGMAVSWGLGNLELFEFFDLMGNLGKRIFRRYWQWHMKKN